MLANVLDLVALPCLQYGKTKKKFSKQSEGKSSKKLKKPKYEDLDQAILSWFHRQRQNNMPISGPLVKAKVENFAEELGLAAFKASKWLSSKSYQQHLMIGHFQC
ncbi:Tigger transposable element-derived protein 5 [Eumeta japonica]|uniref:Tigger transposable element-derived protein 5 n=1 Tax=Eumeta variegata TaxID=151549 RepID=A0A4C1UN15_EUMVA|nr:Tigger transposable element-derived protein 5 [Eumeta japonica]